jgi:hypothetical protein
LKLKEKLASLYIKYYLMPKIEDITHPGFIITKFSSEERELFLRDIFLPELLFSEIENRFEKQYGAEGVKALYAVGKKGGYAYASLSGLTRRSQEEAGKFKNYVWELLQFVGGTYASDVSLEIDLDKKRIDVVFDKFIICEMNGKGYIMTEGGIAGIWAYLIEDPSVEGIQIKCQGRKDDKCHLISQPISSFEQLPRGTANELPKIEYSEEYMEYNKIRKTEYCNDSLEGLLDSQFFDYENGAVISKGIRHFEFDPHIIYFLEEECKKLPNGAELLFQTCFDIGVKIVTSADKKTTMFIMDYLSALGWGDILVLSDNENAEFCSRFYPWTSLSTNSEYIVFRGLVSGMLSSALDKEIKFHTVHIDYDQGYLVISSKTNAK